MKKLALAAFVLIASPAFADDSATLTIRIRNVSDKGGDLRVGLYGRDNFVVRGSKPYSGEVLAAKAPVMTVTLTGLKPGEYGVKVLQDLNRNGRMDMAMMGMMPAEPFGLSNDAQPSMSGPPWDAAKFTLKPGANAIVITLRNP
jgi:uncharacterized protein (DUF2141 family)